MNSVLLQASFRNSIRPISLHGRRSLVSTVLLSKSYEDRTLNELRQEAKSRGLAQYGNKAVLIARIQSEEQRRQQLADSSSSGINGFQPVRVLSTAAAVEAQAAPTPTTSSSQFTLDVKLPDLSESPSASSVHVPYVHDFWQSAKIKAEEEQKAKMEAESAETIPKIMTAASTTTHPAGGPSHKVYDPSSESSAVREKEPSYSRPLNAEEKQGLWVLLGIFAGAWVLGGLGTPSKPKSNSTAKTH